MRAHSRVSRVTCITSCAHKGAFTLLELLVVISIIAVLASMLMPAIGMVRASAYSTRCSVSLNQLSMATMAYANDWDGMLVRLKTPSLGNPNTPAHWFDSLGPYVGMADDSSATSFLSRGGNVIWGCPLWPKLNASTTMFRTGYGMEWFPLAPNSFATNSCWLDPIGTFNTWGVDILYSRVTVRSKRIMLGESLDWPLSTPTVLPVTAYPNSWDPKRHRGRANYAFFDNHVQSIASADNAYLGAADPASTAWNP